MNTQSTPLVPAVVRPFEINNRLVLSLALPMMLAYMSTPLLGMVDTAVVGRMGSAAVLGGLAIGAVLFDLILTTFNFLRAGTTGLTAQALGAESKSEMQATLLRALVVAALGGLVLIAVGPFFITLGLYFMDPGEEVARSTRIYMNWRLYSAPFTLANYALLGWLIGLGRSGLGLAIQTVLNGVNIVLSIVLGLWLGWGIAGVGIATVIAEITATVLGLIIAGRLLDLRRLPGWDVILDRAALTRMMAINRDIMIRSFSLVFAFAFFAAQGARFGELTLAANAVLMNFFLLAGYFLDGLAVSAEQLVGRTIGANYKEGFNRALKMTFAWNVVLALALAAVYLFAGSQLVAIMTTAETVRGQAAPFLLWAALTPLTGVLAFQMDGVFIGATWSRDMSRTMVVALAAYLIAWWLLTPLFGNHGLWMALHLFLICRGLLLLASMPGRLRTTFVG